MCVACGDRTGHRQRTAGRGPGVSGWQQSGHEVRVCDVNCTRVCRRRSRPCDWDHDAPTPRNWPGVQNGRGMARFECCPSSRCENVHSNPVRGLGPARLLSTVPPCGTPVARSWVPRASTETTAPSTSGHRGGGCKRQRPPPGHEEPGAGPSFFPGAATISRWRESPGGETGVQTAASRPPVPRGTTTQSFRIEPGLSQCDSSRFRGGTSFVWPVELVT